MNTELFDVTLTTLSITDIT